MLAHPSVEARLVDPVPLLDRFGAGKLLVLSDAFGHGDAPVALEAPPGRPS
jgi:hypothetical protein